MRGYKPDVTIATQKKIWWTLNFIGFGGTFALLVILHEGGLPRGIEYWCAWPPTFLISGLCLIRCYRIEPMEPLGFWHLTIQDLVAATFLVGMLLAVSKAVLPSHFASVGIPFAVLHAIAFIVGLLTAARSGIKHGKLFYAFAFGMRSVGMLGVGAVIAVALMDKLVFGDAFSWMRHLLYHRTSSWDSPTEIWGLFLHRMALSSLPIGIICGEAVRRMSASYVSTASPTVDTTTPATARR